MKNICFALIVFVAAQEIWAGKIMDTKPISVGKPAVAVPVTPGNFAVRPDSEVLAQAKDFAKEGSRMPAKSSAIVASKDMISTESQNFTRDLIACRTGQCFFKKIDDYDKKYDEEEKPGFSGTKMPNDLRFVVARLATWLPFRGILWRGTPMVHKTVVTQELFLATIRNFAEQAQMNMPDSHLQAQMAFLSMPMPDLMDKRIHSETEFVHFLGTEVYAGLRKAIERLDKISTDQSSNANHPLVYDAQIRFGTHAFGDTYETDPQDRFKIIGLAEKNATIARYYRRLAAISQIAAYNWNGHLDLRREIGRKFGVDEIKSTGQDILSKDFFYINGVTRKERAAVLNSASYRGTRDKAGNIVEPGLYELNTKAGGKMWMKNAYYFLHESYVHLQAAWDSMAKDKNPSNYMQIDPEVFQAREKEVEEGLRNMQKLVGKIGPVNSYFSEAGDGVDGQSPIQGALTGEIVNVNIKGYFENPPQDMKRLFATRFADNKDDINIDEVKKAYPDATFTSTGIVKMTINGKDASWRNYFYGRAIGWNTDKQSYGIMFPGEKDILKAQRVMNEARGAKMISLATSAYVR